MKANSVVGAKSVESLLDVLTSVPDHRTREGRQHPLHAVLALATVATICGCQGQRAIAGWGRLQPPKVRKALGFTKRRTPAHSTIHEILKAVNVVAFEEALRAWAAGLSSSGHGELRAIAIDGKTMRGSAGKSVPGIHVLSAFDVGNGVVLASVALENKGSEAQAAKARLPAIPLEGAVLTGDAAHAQKELCEAIVDSGGDYLFVVKDNQPTLRQAIELAFDPPHSPL